MILNDIKQLITEEYDDSGESFISRHKGKLAIAAGLGLGGLGAYHGLLGSNAQQFIGNSLIKGAGMASKLGAKAAAHGAVEGSSDAVGGGVRTLGKSLQFADKVAKDTNVPPMDALKSFRSGM